jgi:hypothetical protein
MRTTIKTCGFSHANGCARTYDAYIEKLSNFAVIDYNRFKNNFNEKQKNQNGVYLGENL